MKRNTNLNNFKYGVPKKEKTAFLTLKIKVQPFLVNIKLCNSKS